MTQQTIEVEGLPEGWKAVAYRRPYPQEYILKSEGAMKVRIRGEQPWLIIEKIQSRRIVLEETEEDNGLDKFGDPIEQQFGNGVVIYSEKIWKEVKV